MEVWQHIQDTMLYLMDMDIKEYNQEDYEFKSELAHLKIKLGACDNASSKFLRYSEEKCTQYSKLYQENEEYLKIVQEKLAYEKELAYLELKLNECDNPSGKFLKSVDERCPEYSGLYQEKEFKSKLYKNIWKPYFELKQSLVEKVHSGEMSREETDLLLQEEIGKFEGYFEDICLEIKVENNEKHYFCDYE